MEPIFSIDIAKILYDAVLNPNVLSAVWIFIIFLLGEAVAFLPLLVVLTAPVFFLKGSLTVVLITKIFFLVAVPVGLGVSIGSLWLYGLAYWGGKPAIERYGKYLRISWSDVEKARRKLENKRYDGLILLSLRILPLLPTLPVSVAAGLLRMNVWSYLVFTAIGMTARVMLMVFVIGNVV
ncbi:MAG: VTT domain-containing protein [Patescibacteria group bacterium]